jgi:hypothetical protein
MSGASGVGILPGTEVHTPCGGRRGFPGWHSSAGSIMAVAARLSRSRTIVASGIPALTRGPLLSVSALAVTAVAAAKAAGMAARTAEENGAPGPEVIGRTPGTPAPDVTFKGTWTRVEMWWRW